ncbi:PAS domain S-box protein [Methanobacterium sp.]|uniref:PAS domain S-box protein n=1 Tax=Methanobacterium sp. TaxID=2164 RepID=UPI003C7404C8
MTTKILLVENESSEAENIKSILEPLDYEVSHVASNYEDAGKIALNIMPDIILIDNQLNLKKEDIDVKGRINDLNIPIVYLTSYPNEFDIDSMDPYGYIIKPFDKNELKYTLELALYKNRIFRKLKASEEKYKRLAENSKDMIYSMTVPEGKYLYVNQSAETITGYTVDEFYNSRRLLLHSIHPDFRDYYKKTWEQLLKGINPPTYEYKIITKSGKEKWLNQRNSLIKDDRGNPIAIEGNVTDITKQKKVEEELKRREVEFRIEYKKLLRAQRVAEIGIWENNLANNDLHWTEEMYTILGFNPNEQINLQEVIKIFPPEELERFQKAIDGAINNNIPYSMDYKIVRPDGLERYIHDEGQIIRDDSGKAKSMFGTTQDITRRKMVEKSLKDSESKFRNLVETTPDMIWEIDKNGIFTYISPQSSFILGYTPKEIVGKNIFSFIDPEAVDRIKKIFNTHIKNFTEINTLEVPSYRRDGTEITLEIRSVTASDNKDNIDGFQGTARDITERTIATNQLKTSIKEKDILLQEIHHRVKNNMQIISSLLNLQITYLDDDEAVNLLKESQNRVRSMAIIHEKLYQSNDFTKINITEYINSLVNGLFYSYSIKNHINSIINVDDVELNIETAVPVGLILNELISNSLKHGFATDSGEIYIKLKTVDDKYEMIVGDNGIGFPKDLDFKKTESLGLQLVTNLVNQIDGEIELNLNHGTEFKITFPELIYNERI